MSKIEKTLELNITHEILSLADSFWWFLQADSLHRHWHPHFKFPFIPSPRSFATGLHINLEGKSGGGYDVCITSHPYFQGGNPRLLFMQFKAGVEKPFNSNTSSEFYGDLATPNIHIEFDINSNAKNDQHSLLQDLARNSGNEDAVVYVFPRIVDIAQLQQNMGKLLNKTSFISIAEIDKKAADNSVTINDGSPHKFRTCYNDYKRNEVNFFFFFFGEQTKPGGFLGEIFAIRMFRALETLKMQQTKQYDISKYHIVNSMIRYLFHIGAHFSIKANTIISYLNNYPYFNNRLNRFFEFETVIEQYNEEETQNEVIKNAFNDILNTLSMYFKWADQIIDTNSLDIPEPPTDYTIELKENGIRFEMDIDQSNIDEESLNEITYSLF